MSESTARLHLSVAALALIAVALPAAAQEIVVWDWKSGDPVTASYYQQAKEAFEAANPGVTIKYAAQPHDQYYTILGTALASGAGPDVLAVHGGAQAKERTGALIKLDEALADIKGNIAGWSAFEGSDGGAYALPISVQGFAVYYNKEVYANAGLDPEAAPTTWAELTAVCDAIKAKGEAACFTLGNKEGYAAEWFLTMIAGSAWTDAEQAQWADGTLGWTSPQANAVLQAWVDTYADGWYQPGGNSTPKFMDEFEIFMRGEAGNTMGLISDVAHWKQFGEFLGDDNLGAFLLPAPGQPDGALHMPTIGGFGYGVNKDTEHQDLALAFIRELVAPAAMQTFLNDAGAIPSNSQVNLSGINSPSAKAILSWLSLPAAAVAHSAMSTAEVEELHRQSQLLLNGETTVDEAAKRLADVRAAAAS